MKAINMYNKTEHEVHKLNGFMYIKTTVQQFDESVIIIIDKQIYEVDDYHAYQAYFIDGYMYDSYYSFYTHVVMNRRVEINLKPRKEKDVQLTLFV